MIKIKSAYSSSLFWPTLTAYLIISLIFLSVFNVPEIEKQKKHESVIIVDKNLPSRYGGWRVVTL